MFGVRRVVPRPAEACRLTVLLAWTLWLAHPYFAPRWIGTSDALWYHHNLADAVTQFRAGTFPVYVGQSDFSFNGAIYPIRAAPYYQYFAGLLDFITGHSLGFFALEHLTVILSLVGGAFSAYCCLVWMAPGRRWSAVALALLYVMCPGVAGIFYAQDLYMSGMTLPWLPLVFAAMVKSFEDESQRPMKLLAVGLAALWWAHSPIALWVTLVVTCGQAVLLVARRGARATVTRAGIAAAVFCALACYPIVSVFLLRTPGEAIVPYVMDRDLLLKWVGGSFPSSIEPIDPNAPIVSYLQLGYSLWIVFLASVGRSLFRPRLWAVGVLLAAAAVLLVLVFPVPGVTRALWLSFPETLVGMTLYWPMQRLYVIIAAAAVVSAQRLLANEGLRRRHALGVASLFLLLGTIWSSHEASKLIEKGRSHAETAEDSRRWSLPENVAIQRHMYGLFPRRPAYFTHGVVEPRMESRLLDPATGRIVASNYDAGHALPVTDEFHGTIDANPGILDLDPPLTIKSGCEYLLSFKFARADTTGILQMNGPDFHREYLLPDSGDAKSFGSGPRNEKSITVWTTVPGSQTISLRFIPTAPNAVPSDYMPFAKYRLEPIDEQALPVRVESLIPYQATVRSPQPALLETPRMFVPGYAAFVNGSPVPVRKSAEGLVAFPVPSGTCQVELRFAGPKLLRIVFWLNAGGWMVVIFGLGLCMAAPIFGRRA